MRYASISESCLVPVDFCSARPVSKLAMHLSPWSSFMPEGHSHQNLIISATAVEPDHHCSVNYSSIFSLSHLLTGSCRTWKTCLASGHTPSITTCGGTCRRQSSLYSSLPLSLRWPSVPRDTTPGWRLRSVFSFVYVFTERKTDLPSLLFPLHHSLLPHPCALFLQGAERFHSYPPWALAMAYALIVVAMLPLPMVYIARHFNLISDGSNKLSVSYRKGMMKDMSNLEEQDEQRFILSKNPSEAPSPMPAHRAYLGPGGTQEMTNTNYGTSTKTGYQNIGSPESELWFTELIVPPPNKPQPCLERGRGTKKGRTSKGRENPLLAVAAFITP